MTEALAPSSHSTAPSRSSVLGAKKARKRGRGPHTSALTASYGMWGGNARQAAFLEGLFSGPFDYGSLARPDLKGRMTPRVLCTRQKIAVCYFTPFRRTGNLNRLSFRPIIGKGHLALKPPKPTNMRWSSSVQY